MKKFDLKVRGHAESLYVAECLQRGEKPQDKIVCVNFEAALGSIVHAMLETTHDMRGEFTLLVDVDDKPLRKLEFTVSVDKALPLETRAEGEARSEKEIRERVARSMDAWHNRMKQQAEPSADRADALSYAELSLYAAADAQKTAQTSQEWEALEKKILSGMGVPEEFVKPLSSSQPEMQNIPRERSYAELDKGLFKRAETRNTVLVLAPNYTSFLEYLRETGVPLGDRRRYKYIDSPIAAKTWDPSIASLVWLPGYEKHLYWEATSQVLRDAGFTLPIPMVSDSPGRFARMVEQVHRPDNPIRDRMVVLIGNSMFEFDLWRHIKDVEYKEERLVRSVKELWDVPFAHFRVDVRFLSSYAALPEWNEIYAHLSAAFGKHSVDEFLQAYERSRSVKSGCSYCEEVGCDGRCR